MNALGDSKDPIDTQSSASLQKAEAPDPEQFLTANMLANKAQKIVLKALGMAVKVKVGGKEGYVSIWKAKQLLKAHNYASAFSAPQVQMMVAGVIQKAEKAKIDGEAKIGDKEQQGREILNFAKKNVESYVDLVLMMNQKIETGGQMQSVAVAFLRNFKTRFDGLEEAQKEIEKFVKGNTENDEKSPSEMEAISKDLKALIDGYQGMQFDLVSRKFDENKIGTMIDACKKYRETHPKSQSFNSV